MMVFPCPKVPLFSGVADLHSSSGMCLLDFPCCTLGTSHAQITVSRCLVTLASLSHVSFIHLPYSRRSAPSACAIPLQEHPGQCESHSSFCWTILLCLVLLLKECSIPESFPDQWEMFTRPANPCSCVSVVSLLVQVKEL